MDRTLHRRVAAPIGLFAALAIAAGGGSSPLALRPSAADLAPAEQAAGLRAGPATVHLEHLELVALRAQAAPQGFVSGATP